MITQLPKWLLSASAIVASAVYLHSHLTPYTSVDRCVDLLESYEKHFPQKRGPRLGLDGYGLSPELAADLDKKIFNKPDEFVLTCVDRQ